MNIAAIIPARYNSTRFIGKPLVKIKGIPMIERVYRQVSKCKNLSHENIIIATDDQRIKKVVKNFGGNVVMTSTEHRSGSERIWEVLEKSNFDAAINIQGDEPVVPVDLITKIYEQLEMENSDVVTPVYFNQSYEQFISKNVVKAVISIDNHALYFSRSPIPFTEKKDFAGFYHHIGMYGYHKNALKKFIEKPQSQLERIEKLEQLRFLENGISIKVIISNSPSLGVDTPEDLTIIENMLDKSDERY